MLDEESQKQRWLKKLGIGVLWLTIAHSILRFNSLRRQIEAVFRRTRKWNFSPLSNGPLFVIAIWERESLRPDVAGLLKVLRMKGFNSLVVNTSRLTESQIAQLDCSIYLERFNFGRDFGSYKEAMLHLYKWHPGFVNSRLVLLNDSVFYSEQGLEIFVDELATSSFPVVGATENFEIRHHLGSFAVSVSSEILRNKRFQKYWYRYRKTDLRTKTIKRGEMGLSKVLASVSTSNPPLRAMYSVSRVAEMTNEYPELVERIHNAARNCTRNWESQRPNTRIEIARRDFTFFDLPQDTDVTIRHDDHSSYFTGTYEDGLAAFCSSSEGSLENKKVVYHRSMRAFILNQWTRGSQIHQNATVLPLIGCPIVKLDLEYRGVTDAWDLETICAGLPKSDAKQVRILISSRPYGYFMLTKWRLAAFLFGLI